MFVDDYCRPSQWAQIPLKELEGPVLIVGDSDTGKSTLTYWLWNRLRETGRATVYLDGDPGQSRLGPPTTLTARGCEGQELHWFVGSNTPRGHMLPLVTGARRLLDAFPDADVCLYDTTGFIDQVAGGVYLKQAKLDVLQPSTVIALQRERELETILNPLRRRHGLNLFEIPVAEAVQHRDQTRRRTYRQRKYKQYFQDGSLVTLDWTRRAVWPGPEFRMNQLIGLCDRRGFARALGLVKNLDHSACTVQIMTPCDIVENVAEIRVGDLQLDPRTYLDQPLNLEE